ncbi:MAG TPA: transglycosylase SLT domain-containing protein, partial [Candidatus Rubrimentiphilum sp.]|nr:transglycosylase SLT domain-containing protein [Candidatus Rubrimentiphilum sp.]
MPSSIRLRVAAGICLAICACAGPARNTEANTEVFIPGVTEAAMSWHAPMYANTLYGLRPLQDGPRTRSVTLAIARAVLHTNTRLAPVDALLLAGWTERAARAQGLPPEFLAATLLQESAFDPRAISSAGAIGIAQFMPETAADAGIDPRDPFAAIAGAAALLGSYERAYDSTYANPLAAALAAYNAGPGAVSAYHGVPPYAET